MHRLLPILVLLSGCIAHAPEPHAGADAVVVAGLQAPVTIYEDAIGVPHIRADSVPDALFAQGWVHAEERLWQMDLNRRVGLGRLSEFFGRRTLDTDRFLRTVGFAQAAQDALDRLPPEDLALLESYAAGVNAFLASDADLPPEYRILGVRPEAWTPLHSVVWTKMMAWTLSASADDDALRDGLEAAIGETQAAWFLPEYPADGVRILPPDQMQEHRTGAPDAPPPPAEYGSRSGADAEVLAGLNDLLGRGDSVGSNNWVVAGSATRSGLPLLSNDPHLGVSVPSIWYLVGIDAPGLHLAGASFPGLPGIVIGHNERVAWGLTNSPYDVQDLYRERLIGDDAVERPGGPEALSVRVERIVVKGGPDQDLTVRASSLGPLVTAYYPGYDEEVALRWTALDPDDTTLSAILDLWTADSVDGAWEALRGFTAPAQNVVLADVGGRIAWKAPGRVPVRDAGFDGRGAGRGWVPADHWNRYVDWDALPGARDPLQGYIATANNAPVPADWSTDFGAGFATPHRAERIEDLLEQGEGRTVEGHQRMQNDVHSVQAEELLPILVELEPTDPLEQSAVALLAEWAGQHGADSAGAAVYNAWLIEAIELLAKERLGDDLWPRWKGTHGGFLTSVFAGEAWPLCLRPATRRAAATANCSELAHLALTGAVKTLKKALGPDPLAWRWGDLHVLTWHHSLAFTPHLKAQLDTAAEAPGGPWTLNMGAFRYRTPFDMVWHASYRQVLDLSDWDNSRWMHAPGQSGVPWRDHYRDLAEPWLAGVLAPMPFTRGAVESASVRQRQLDPDPRQ